MPTVRNKAVAVIGLKKSYFRSQSETVVASGKPTGR